MDFRTLSLLCLLLCIASTSFGQSIPPAPDDKAVVYFVRLRSVGVAVYFTYFDNDQVIGKANERHYFRYECEPGEHLFWARSENKDFLLANLEAGKIYFVEALPVMGAVKAGVYLAPLDPQVDVKRMKKVFKLMDRFPPTEFRPEFIQLQQEYSEGILLRAKKKYEKDREYIEKAPWLKVPLEQGSDFEMK